MLAISLGLALMQSPAVLEHMQAGIAAEKAGQHDAALAAFHQAAEIDPSLTAAWVDLGMVYMGQHAYALAVDPLRHALELDPNIAAAQEMLGYALLSQGYAAEAVAPLEKAGNPGMLGLAELEAGNLVNAITHLQAGLAQHPNDPELLSAMAQAAGVLSRQSKDALLAAHPESAQAHQALAGDYWSLQKATEAEGEYRNALAVQPALPGVHLALGQMYESTQQWPKAEQEYRLEAKLRPGSAEAAFRLGNALLQNGKLPGAVASLHRSDTLQPDMPETLYALGKAESLSGELPAAVKDWSRLLGVEKASDLAEKAHFGLAGIYRKQGKPEDAAREMLAYQQLKTH